MLFIRWSLESREEEDDGYDELEPGFDLRCAEVDGDVNEDLNSQIVENPYYGDLTTVDTRNTVMDNPYYDDNIEFSTQDLNSKENDDNADDPQIITTVKNIYYEL